MTQSLSKTSSIRYVYLLNMLPIIGLFVYYYTHYLEGTYSFIIPLSLTVIWLFLSVLTGNVKGLLSNKVSVWWMAYLLVCVFMVIIGFSSTNMNHIISRLSIYLTPAIGYFVVRNYNKKEKNVLLVAFFIIFFANLLYNIFIGFQLPEIFEKQVSSEESINFRRLMNLADTEFIVVGYWLIGSLLLGVVQLKNKNMKLLCFLLIIPIAYHMMFQNTRGTAILLLFVELFGFLLAYNEPKRRNGRGAYYVFTIVLSLLLLFIVFVPLMRWILENIQSERLAERFNDLLDFGASRGDMNQVSEGSFSQRVLLIQTSLNTFFSSPLTILIGIGDQATKLGTDLVKSGIGEHSEFIDVLARYGLVGAFVFWKIMKSYHWMLCRLTRKRDILKYVNVIFVIIVLSGFLNNIFHCGMMLFMFLIFPVMVEKVDNNSYCSNGR